jgi:hypothetical protein
LGDVESGEGEVEEGDVGEPAGAEFDELASGGAESLELFFKVNAAACVDTDDSGDRSWCLIGSPQSNTAAEGVANDPGMGDFEGLEELVEVLGVGGGCVGGEAGLGQNCGLGGGGL